MLSHREWFFRLSYLSLSLLINPFPARGADIPGGIASWVIRQSVQVIAGVMGVKTSDYLLKGNGHADAHYKIDTMIQDNKRVNNAQSVKVDTASQGGKGTTTAKAKQQSGKEYEQYILDEWQKQANQYDDKKLDDVIALTEGNLDSAKADRSYYKQGTKARTELEDAINFEEQSLAQLKEIKESRQKERISKQATTVAATAAVLTTKTAPVSEPKALEPSPIPGENIWKMQETIGDKHQGPEILERRAKDRQEQRAKEREEKEKERNQRDPGEPPHKSDKNLEFIEKDKPAQYHHQWRDEGGHFKVDTPTARELIQRAVKEGNYRGVKDGKHQYDWVNPETGEQVWVETMGSKVQAHGLNIDPWKVDPTTGFIKKPDGYIRANVPSVVRCDVTGVVIWPLVPALMDKLEREAEKPNPIPDTEVRKLANAAINNYLKENPISGTVIKMPTYAIPVPPSTAANHPTPSAHKTDGFIVPAKASTVESIMKDNGCKCKNSWWSYTPPSKPSKSVSSDDIDWDSLDRKSQKSMKKFVDADGNFDYSKLEAATAKTTESMIAYLNKD